MKLLPCLRALSCLLLLTAAKGATDDPSASLGYPRPQMFRSNTPENLAVVGSWTDFVISDQFVAKRKYSDEAFKLRYPDKPVLIHVGGEFISANAYTSKQMMEDRGLIGTELAAEYIKDHGGYAEVLRDDFVPMPDFLGYWIYQPGQTAHASIPARQMVDVEVDDPSAFAAVVAYPPASRALSQKLLGTDKTARVVLLCPRDGSGQLDWPKGELGEVVATDAAKKTVTVRRFKTSRGWPEMPAGFYLASNAANYNRDDQWGMKHTPEGHPYHNPLWPWMMPNFTPFCPVDPRNGLNAVQWIARHFVERKQKYFPHSDGYALDVTTPTFIPGTGFIANADCNNDGVADMAQIGGVNYWVLGMNDFVYYMRNGVPGKFAGLGSRILFTWDSDTTDEQRFFHLVNGGEYEFGIIRDTGLFSSSLDRLLLWFDRGQSPKLTFVSDKLPNPIFHQKSVADLPDEPGYRIGDLRLNIATACLGTGYIHSDSSRSKVPGTTGFPGIAAERKKYGGEPLPLDYDEYHRGKDGVYGWLGEPVAPPQRYRGHLGAPVYRFDGAAALPTIQAEDERWKASSVRTGPRSLRLDVTATGPYYTTEQKFSLLARLPLPGIAFREQGEYSLRFRAHGSSPYAAVNERYRPIPRGITVRLRVNGVVSGPQTPKPQKAKGNIQDLLLFEDDRPIDVTLISPAAGEGVLEICLSESPGVIDLSDLEIRSGSGDVLYRKFEHGAVVLNGSEKSSVTLPMKELFPGENYRRIDGTQDPEHNNGRPVGDRLEIAAHDAYLLVKDSP